MYSGFIKLAKESGATITSVWGKYDDTHLGCRGSGVLTRDVMFWATFSGAILCATTIILMSVAAAMKNSGNSVIKALRANESAVLAVTPVAGVILLILLLALYSIVKGNRLFNQKLPSRLTPMPKWNLYDDIGPFSGSIDLINDGVLPAINTALKNANRIKHAIACQTNDEYIHNTMLFIKKVTSFVSFISCIKSNIEKVSQLLTNLNTIFVTSAGERSFRDTFSSKELVHVSTMADDIHTHIQALYLQSTLMNLQCHDLGHGHIFPSKCERVEHLKHTKSCAFNFGHDFNKLVSYLNDLKERETINEDITTKIRNTNLRCITPDIRLPSYSEATSNEPPPSQTLTSASVAPLQEYEISLG